MHILVHHGILSILLLVHTSLRHLIIMLVTHIVIQLMVQLVGWKVGLATVCSEINGLEFIAVWHVGCSLLEGDGGLHILLLLLHIVGLWVEVHRLVLRYRHVLAHLSIGSLVVVASSTHLLHLLLAVPLEADVFIA